MALVFFDIDGTLWDFDNNIPESTKTALRMLKENGHQIFICSGRTKVYIRSENLLSLGFDGIISGCGTRIEYRGQELLYHTIEPDLLVRTVKLFDDFGMDVMMESRDWLFMDADRMSRDEFGKQLVETLQEVIQPIRDNEQNWEASKFTVMINHADFRKATELLAKDFEVMVHGEYVMEVVPKGYTKAAGIQFMHERLGVDRADTYAFGDGENDLEMLGYAGCGIAMGNGADKAKEQADHVTDDIHADGIYNACKHFGLI